MSTEEGIQELFLISHPWSLSLAKPIPATLFRMAALTRLYLGFWRFLATAGLACGAAVPSLRELGLCGVFVSSRDIDFVLFKSPVLEILCFECIHMFPALRLRLVSQSLRCVQIHATHLESVTVVDAPRLERLILRDNLDSKNRIKIGNAPALCIFGYFELEKDVLQIGNTVFKSRINPSAMVLTVKTLALPLQFGVCNDAKMLPSFLRCFPNLETLHIYSKKTTETTGKLNLKFWQESGAI
uniref:F-box/LRR-repeat protein 15/At3g58940/PEG3-like LRR domain-containing protein n=1 Tax=Arundo donax TaxID=35708 RepID=A0A0A9GJX6_ARUDO